MDIQVRSRGVMDAASENGSPTASHEESAEELDDGAGRDSIYWGFWGLARPAYWSLTLLATSNGTAVDRGTKQVVVVHPVGCLCTVGQVLYLTFGSSTLVDVLCTSKQECLPLDQGADHPRVRGPRLPQPCPHPCPSPVLAGQNDVLTHVRAHAIQLNTPTIRVVSEQKSTAPGAYQERDTSILLHLDLRDPLAAPFFIAQPCWKRMAAGTPIHPDPFGARRGGTRTIP
ncbi:hypothetical protein BP6252_11546 [Coleophoma cylindrospora]|uniref:Uncharacterized protein n=1 Tax=Coleophoma cylindrospora TaxID=1849047 RepID=A0A3D8QJW6_9HELO|nr:hypothetical protein BP6252_11546 [Coleophoma cylindrospora]